MIGGKVIGISRRGGVARLHVADCQHSPRCGMGYQRPDTCCVLTSERRLRDGIRIEIRLGDSVWWQAGKLLWTPRDDVGRLDNVCGQDCDIALEKL